MPAIVCLLRGVNVGGNNKIKMDALRALCESLGLDSPRTYVNSGNAVFQAKERNLDSLARRIEDTIERSAGFRPAVILRTAAEMAEVVSRNPFASREDIPASKLLVTFLAREPDPAARVRAAGINRGPEELHILGREIYTYFPNGMGRSKFPFAAFDRALGVSGTGRNWNSVTKLLEMAQGMA